MKTAKPNAQKPGVWLSVWKAYFSVMSGRRLFGMWLEGRSYRQQLYLNELLMSNSANETKLIIGLSQQL